MAFAIAFASPAQPASVSGVVLVHGLREPLQDSEVKLSSKVIPQDRVTKSDKEGRYRFEGLPAGEYSIRISAFAFRPLKVDSIQLERDEHRQIPAVQVTVVDVTCGTPPAAPNFVRLLKPGVSYGTIAGAVHREHWSYDQTWEPLFGAKVCLRRSDMLKTTVMTDARGEFLFTQLEPDIYTIEVEKPGFYSSPVDKVEVWAGFESPAGAALWKCRWFSCRERYRPKRPQGFCE